MRRTFLPALAAAMMLTGAAVAGELELSDSQMDTVTAGADITTNQIATAIATYDVTTNADHDVNVVANAYTNVDATIVQDTSAVGSSTSQSVLQISSTNN